MRRYGTSPIGLPLILLFLGACAERPGAVPEVSEAEVTPQVVELDAIHEVMVPMWHEAFPARDIPAIQGAVPDFEPMLLALDSAILPGILQDKQDQWDEGKVELMRAFQELKAAAESGDDESVLAAAEVFHMTYEGLVRVIRPVVPELDAFHRHLYGIYHYYGPGYDVEKIRDGAEAMAAAIPALQAAELPAGLQDLQGEFEDRVAELGNRVAELLMTLENPQREEVDAAIEDVHQAYQAVEDIFD